MKGSYFTVWWCGWQCGRGWTLSPIRIHCLQRVYAVTHTYLQYVYAVINAYSTYMLSSGGAPQGGPAVALSSRIETAHWSRYLQLGLKSPSAMYIWGLNSLRVQCRRGGARGGACGGDFISHRNSAGPHQGCAHSRGGQRESFQRQVTGPNPLNRRVDLVDRPRAIGV